MVGGSRHSAAGIGAHNCARTGRQFPKGRMYIRVRHGCMIARSMLPSATTLNRRRWPFALAAMERSQARAAEPAPARAPASDGACQLRSTCHACCSAPYRVAQKGRRDAPQARKQPKPLWRQSRLGYRGRGRVPGSQKSALRSTEAAAQGRNQEALFRPLPTVPVSAAALAGQHSPPGRGASPQRRPPPAEKAHNPRHLALPPP